MSKDQVNDSVREEFRKLNLDAKAAFLVEAIFSTAGSAINEIGGRLTSLVSLVTDPFEENEEENEKDGEPREEASEAASDDESGGKASSAKKGSPKSGSGKGRSTKK